MFKQLILSSLLVLGALGDVLPRQHQQQPLNENDISNRKIPKTVDLIHEQVLPASPQHLYPLNSRLMATLSTITPTHPNH